MATNRNYVVLRTLNQATKKYEPRAVVTTADAVLFLDPHGGTSTTLEKKMSAINQSVQHINQQIESGSIGGGGSGSGVNEEMMSIHSSDKDEKGIFRVVEFKRPDSTKYMVSTLSEPDEKGKYAVATWQYYNTEGTEVTRTIRWDLGYDDSGDLISKTPSIVESPGIGG